MVQLLNNILGKKLELLVLTLFAIGATAFVLTPCAFGFILRAGSITRFSPSEPRVAYAPGSDKRGTISLIWSCISTIFSCVYVSVHVDVPNPSKGQEFKEELHREPTVKIPEFVFKAFFWIWDWTAQPKCRRVIWMLFNIYAPELVVFVALIEYMSATSGKRFMREVTKSEEWTMTHAFFADMGGFMVEEGGGTRVLATGRQFYEWFVDNEMPQLDYTALKDDIDDRSKASGLLKALTCLQVVWVIVETLMRAIEHRPVSELEVATCAYILCSLLIYCFWWSKPYDVGKHVLVRPLATNGTINYRQGYVVIEDLESLQEKMLPKIPEIPYESHRLTPFNRAFDDPFKAWLRASYVCGIIGALVGGIHCSLWNAQFINSTGQWMWRFSCVMQLALPVGVAAVSKIETWYVGMPLYLFMLFMAFVYCVSRTLLFVLIGLSFWSLPAGVYTDVNWAIPHWR